MRYVFGGYSLDTQRSELRRAGELIPLGPQVFNVLAYLVAHCDRIVSRNELFARLWPGQFVTDDALGRCIRAARQALADRPEAPRYIMTSRGRGYRFIAPVQEQPHGPPEDGAATGPAQSRPPLSSVAGRAGLPPPVALPIGAGERQHLAAEVRPPLLAGEYKPVTVLCGGLADALALARRLGPEAMHQRLQLVFTVVHQVLPHYGGSLIEFGGEGFVALFGAPMAQEDHAQRAVLAALALHAHVGVSAPDLGQAPAEPLTQARAEVAMTMATDHGFWEQVALATPLRDWALAATAEGEEGIAQSHQGLAASQATEATRDRSDRLALLAETFAYMGQITKGLEALAEGLATVAKSRVRLWEAELYRLRGELLLQQTAAQAEEAEACLQQALTAARRQQAKSWELRAVMSLSRLWQRQGKRAAAHELLAPVYGWFTEGFDTVDLREAKTLLEELEV